LVSRSTVFSEIGDIDGEYTQPIHGLLLAAIMCKDCDTTHQLCDRTSKHTTAIVRVRLRLSADGILYVDEMYAAVQNGLTNVVDRSWFRLLNSTFDLIQQRDRIVSVPSRWKTCN
jgi:hypothetical protein